MTLVASGNQTANRFLEDRKLHLELEIFWDSRPNFIWLVYRVHTTVKLLGSFQQLFVEAVKHPTPNNFQDRTICMFMLNDIELNSAGNEQMCIKSAEHAADVSKDFKPDHRRHIGPDPSSPGTTTRSNTFEVHWNPQSIGESPVVGTVGHATTSPSPQL